MRATPAALIWPSHASASLIALPLSQTPASENGRAGLSMSLPFGMVSRDCSRSQLRPRRGHARHLPSLIVLLACLPPRFWLLQQPQIILLKEGTDTSQGKPQLISNINACAAVADVVRTTLGPRGMDKLMHDDRVRPSCLLGPSLPCCLCGWRAAQLPTASQRRRPAAAPRCRRRVPGDQGVLPCPAAREVLLVLTCRAVSPSPDCRAM